MIHRRRRFKQKLSLEDRLSLFAQAARDQAAHLPPGAEKDSLLRKAQQAETTADLKQWMEWPTMQSSK